VIFEQIGQLARVTAYLHVHVELSISSVEAQLAKYHKLLRQNCGTELAVLNYMMAYVNSSHYIRKEVCGDKPEDLPESSTVRQNGKLWYKVVRMHIRDLEDMGHGEQHHGPEELDAGSNRYPHWQDPGPGPVCSSPGVKRFQSGCLHQYS